MAQSEAKIPLRRLDRWATSVAATVSGRVTLSGLLTVCLSAAFATFPTAVRGDCASQALHDIEEQGTGSTGIPRKLAPFSPTPMVVVEAMLMMARVGENDLVYDLGSGDGRIVVTAAKRYGARAVGFEIESDLVRKSRDSARRAGVDGLVEIRQQDFMTADLSAATVVTLYLVPDANLRLRPLLLEQLRPGARVVSHEFDMGDWQPDEVQEVRDSSGYCYTVFLWRIGE